MKRSFKNCVLVLSASTIILTSGIAGEFKVGATAVAITPAIGTPLAGSYSVRVSTGLLDELYAKAIVVEQDGDKAALVALDLGYTTRGEVAAARKLIAQQTGIAPERVIISATHTHSGPVQMRNNHMDDLTGAKRPAAVEFTSNLPVLIARAVGEANTRMVPARAFAVIGREEHLSFNRRYWMKDGTVAWMPPKLSPNIVRPAGPVDPDVGLCYLESATKEPASLATYANFAMHPTAVGGSKFSADYPGCLAKRLAEYKGTSMVTVFANGCCGNVNQRNPNWQDSQSGLREAERIGTILAAAAFRAWPNLQLLNTFAPRAHSEIVNLPRRKISDEEVVEARRTFENRDKSKVNTPDMANAVCVLETAANSASPLEAEVQVIALSDEFAVVALPGEIFVELGLDLKKRSPFKYTFITEQANGSIGYIPNRSAYGEGKYEVVSARCAEGSGEMLVEAALKILQALHSSH